MEATHNSQTLPTNSQTLPTNQQRLANALCIASSALLPFHNRRNFSGKTTHPPRGSAAYALWRTPYTADNVNNFGNDDIFVNNDGAGDGERKTPSAVVHLKATQPTQPLNQTSSPG